MGVRVGVGVEIAPGVAVAPTVGIGDGVTTPIPVPVAVTLCCAPSARTITAPEAEPTTSGVKTTEKSQPVLGARKPSQEPLAVQPEARNGPVIEKLTGKLSPVVFCIRTDCGGLSVLIA